MNKALLIGLVVVLVVGCASAVPETQEKRYFVAWRSDISGATGRGNVSLPADAAQSICNLLNGRWRGEFTHFLEEDTSATEEERTEG